MNFTRITGLRSLGRYWKISTTQRNLSTHDVKKLQLMRKYERNKNLCFTSTYTMKSVDGEKSWVKTVMEKIPFLSIDKTKMRASAYLLYEEIADSIDYLAFINNFSLPDTFYSWFVVTELHIWMLSVRAMAEEDGRHIRNFLVEALWLDVAQRTKKLGAANPAAMRTSISELSEQLQAALIAYDEGLQTDDMVLASALWRRFYQFEGVDLDHLEKLVKYVRKQITLLDSTSSDKLLKEGTVGWKPLGE